MWSKTYLLSVMRFVEFVANFFSYEFHERRKLRVITLAPGITFLLLLFVTTSRVQQTEVAGQFEIRDQMIRARDGVRLHTKFFLPKGRSGPLPKHATALPARSH